ncbi:MAG: N-acetylglutaminylglutamine amidotransferase [Solirubrobacteraceae bacterium]
MCGLAGELNRHGPPDLEGLRRMSGALAPRGPDGSGLWHEGGAALAHRRLKVIDLSSSASQPMVDAELGLVTAFNGCIYNHRELRAELEREGYAFHSRSDTEVIAKALHRWGPREFASHLLGMFAFAVVDPRSGRTVLARDRLGIKPLYLTDPEPGVTRFASTLPALLAGGGVATEIDPVALHHYLSFHSVVPAPRTILRTVRRLEPATVLVVEADGTCQSHCYWAPDYRRDELRADWSPGDWAAATKAALALAVRRRMLADVPVGVLLSGGLDSSLIVALLAEQGQSSLATFSIGFEAAGGRSGDEFEYSNLIAREFETDHHCIRISGDRLLDALTGAIAAMSEPMVSHDVVAFHLLSQEVSRHVKVVQSGQGADEVFAGYEWYPPLAEVEACGDEVYAREFIDRTAAESAAMVVPELRCCGDPSRELIARSFAADGAATALDRALRLDGLVMLVDDPVKRVDNMTMAFGVEARTPFLDHQLVELAAVCPPELKLADGGKGPLKQLARGLLPDSVIDRPKSYFPVPALTHLEGEVLELVYDAASERSVRARGIFDVAHVSALAADPNGHRTTLGGSKLWQVALLELWLRAHVDG